MENFAAVGAVSYGTFKSGTIVITTDGSTYSVSMGASEALTLEDSGASSGKNAEPSTPPSSNAGQEGSSGSGYIGNSNSYIYHLEGCASVKLMSEKNKVYSTKAWFIANGYRGCQRCNP